jgi:cell volume regulation protein A
MAVLLTLALVQVIMGEQAGPVSFVAYFVRQLAVGGALGFAVGRVAVFVINRIRLDAAGLYPVLAAVFGLVAYGGAAVVGGNGFLSVYVAGIVMGNSRLVFQRGTLLLHDGLAWIAQMVMFILLGLLSTPTDLLDVASDGLLVAAVLMLVARPLMIIVMLTPFGFPIRELVFC